jgi:hypothetical protein
VKLAAALLFLCGLAGAPDALAVKASMEAEVAPSTWKSIRLRGLPKNGSLAVRVQSTGPINVVLLHETELARFPKPVRPAFAAALERRLSFKVTLPLAGTYYIVLDNRKGEQTRTVKILFEALRPRAPKAPAKPNSGQKLEAI